MDRQLCEVFLRWIGDPEAVLFFNFKYTTDQSTSSLRDGSIPKLQTLVHQVWIPYIVHLTERENNNIGLQESRNICVDVLEKKSINQLVPNIKKPTQTSR